ncbi:CorA family divalent cation transporter [Pontibacterium sp.]|uniref:CorA family divalent cation transporter n=2 Tax=Pontibacterium sp. TaxID=2036026 RepID=UPI0035142E55
MATPLPIQSTRRTRLVRPGTESQPVEQYAQLAKRLQSREPFWLELDWNDPDAAEWLKHSADLPESSCQAVLTENTRPRSFTDEHGNLVLILRIINTQATTEAERLVSLRLLIDRKRIFSLCHYETEVLRQVRTKIGSSDSCFEPAQLLTSLLRWIQEEINEEVYRLTELVSDIEGQLDRGKPPVDEISMARKRAGELQRYLQPQRIVLSQLRQQRDITSDAELQSDWRELANELQLSLEEVEMSISRLMIFQDEVRSNLNERTTRTLYLLSLVTFLFLPLSFLTGFLGMNISFPWETSPQAFWLLLVLIIGILLGQVWLIKRLGWL